MEHLSTAGLGHLGEGPTGEPATKAARGLDVACGGPGEYAVAAQSSPIELHFAFKTLLASNAE
jgi:hypothetical protein